MTDLYPLAVSVTGDDLVDLVVVVFAGVIILTVIRWALSKF
jgi:hypothetical protein